MKRNILLIGVIISVILINGCAQQTAKDAKVVTIKELTSDMAKFDGQNILVRGKFTDMGSRPFPACVAVGTSENPEIRDSYKTYRSSWGISNQDGEIGVDVTDETGAHIGTLPNYSEGQEIELKGVARATTVADDCNKDVRHRSAFIEVNAKDIDTTSKPLPKKFTRE